MHRTQIYLTENLYKRLNQLKNIKRQSIAYIIREILTKHMEQEEKGIGNNLIDLVNFNFKKNNLNCDIKNILNKK